MISLSARVCFEGELHPVKANKEKMKIVSGFFIKKRTIWWLGAESNCPPMGYESIALTN